MSKYEDSPAAADIEIIELPSEPLVVVLASDHPVVAANGDITEAARFPWAMPTPAPIGARDLPQPFDEALAAGRFPFYRLETTAACLDLAKAGRAITMVPRSLAKEACRGAPLVYLDAPLALRTNDGIHLVRHRTRSPSTRLMIDQIIEVATQIARA